MSTTGPSWQNESGLRESLLSYQSRATPKEGVHVAIPEAPARPAIAFDWYRVFIQMLLDNGSYTWFAKLIVAGELLLGIALILGAFVGIAAFFAGFMNWNFMMAGTASTNPVLFALSILLILAWKTAGWWGLDRWLLPRLGTPWRPSYSDRQVVKIPQEVPQ